MRDTVILMSLVVLCLFASAPATFAAIPPQTIAVIDSALADSNGLVGQVVYVDFWASWCVPCRKSFPWLAELSTTYKKQGVRVVTVNVDTDKKSAAKFLADLGSALPVIYDPKGVLAERYSLDVMPSSFIYGRDGRLRSQRRGFRPQDSYALDSLIHTLVEEKVQK